MKSTITWPYLLGHGDWPANISRSCELCLLANCYYSSSNWVSLCGTFFIYTFGHFRFWNLKVALGPNGLRRVRSHMLRRWKERRLGTFMEEEAYGCTTQYSQGFDVANTNKDWVLSPCSSWNTGGFWSRLTSIIYVEHCWLLWLREKRAWQSMSWLLKLLTISVLLKASSVPNKEVTFPWEWQ